MYSITIALYHFIELKLYSNKSSKDDYPWLNSAIDEFAVNKVVFRLYFSVKTAEDMEPRIFLAVVSKYIKPVVLEIKYCIKGLEKGIDDR